MTPGQARWSIVAVVLLCELAFNAHGVSAQALNFERVSTIPGPAELIRVHRSSAYVTADKTLTVYDMSNPAAPKRLGAYSFPFAIRGFRVVDHLIYVAADLFGLGILDVSDGVPRLHGSLKTPGQAKSVAVVGTKAVVADMVSGLDIIDISNPAKPVQVGSIFLEGFASEVVAAGRLAYASDRPSGFYVVDPSKPDVTEPLSALQSSNLATFPAQAQIEIVQPSAPGPPIAIWMAGGLMQLFDVSNPAAPVELAPYRTPGRPLRTFVDGTRAYVADGPAGVQIVDLATPGKPRLVGGYKTSSPAVDVTVANGLVFVVLFGGDVIVLRQTAA